MSLSNKDKTKINRLREESKETLIELENTFGLNTSEVVKEDELLGISKATQDLWINHYLKFCSLDGDLQEINTQ